MTRKRLALILTAGVIALSAGSWWIADWRGSRRLERALERARESGLFEPTADQGIVAAHPDGQPSGRAERLIRSATDLFMESPHSERLSGYGWSIGDDPAQMPDGMRTDLAALEPVFELLVRATRESDSMHLPQSDPQTAIDPVGLLSMAQAMAMNTLRRSSLDDRAMTERNLHSVFVLVDALAESTSSLDQVVRISLLRVVADSALFLLPEERRAVERLLTGLPEIEGVAASIARGETLVILDIARTIDEVGITQGILVPVEESRGSPAQIGLWQQTMALAIRPFVRHHAADFLEYLDEFQQTSRLPYPRAIPECETLSARFMNERHVIDNLFMFNLMPILRNEVELVARIRVLRIATRLLDHRARTGSFPASLAELEPTAADRDPYNDEPFVLEQDGTRVTLRSAAEPKVCWTSES